jgi:uncharacterized protein YegP (UPF0339 family)
MGFIENRGQFHPACKFTFRRPGQLVWCTKEGLIFDLFRKGMATADTGRTDHASKETPRSRTQLGPVGRAIVRQRFRNGNTDPRIEPHHELSPRHNYFYGSDPQKWQLGAKGYREITYHDVWRGIDVRIITTGQDFKQEFIVRPKANPAQIEVAFQGIQRLQIAPDGALMIATAVGDMREHPPQIYQHIDGRRVHVGGRFRLVGEAAYSFDLDSYDLAHELVIDPTLSYSTYLGGHSFDEAFGIALDTAGNMYVTGWTVGVDLPTTEFSHEFDHGLGPEANIPADGRVFVAKLDPSGTALIYMTFLGGLAPADEIGRAIAVDGDGNAYVTGSTIAEDFPTLHAFQPTFGGLSNPTTSLGRGDGFVAKLDHEGKLLYSTFLGGSRDDVAVGIAVDSTGSAYVAGHTFSSDFPVQNAVQPDFKGDEIRCDGFVAKLNPAGDQLVYSTYLGGKERDVINAIAVDRAGHAYVVGQTQSDDFPVTPGTLQSSGRVNAFIAKLDPAGSTLEYSTLLGGKGVDEGMGIAVDDDGNAYVAGTTDSPDFPTVNAFQSTRRAGEGLFGSRSDAFVAKLNKTGTALLFSTYLGGLGTNAATAIAVDSKGNAYVTGETAAANFPVVDPIQPSFAGTVDAGFTFSNAFVAKFDRNGKLLFSSFLGGTGPDSGNAIAADTDEVMYVVGSTQSPNFPTVAAFQPQFNPSIDGFIAAIRPTALSGVFALSKVIPGQGGDAGETSVVLHGSSFKNGAAAKLSRSGVDILGTAVVVKEPGDRLFATFDLTGKPRGAWDVAVTNPDGSSAVLPGGFSVEEVRKPELWVDLVGRTVVKFSEEEVFTIVVANRGNVDAVGVPLWLTGIPENSTWRTEFTIHPPPNSATPSVSIPWEQVPAHLELGTGSALPLFLTRLAAGAVNALAVRISMPMGGDDAFNLRAWMTRPFFQSPLNSEQADCLTEMISAILHLLEPLIPISDWDHCAKAALGYVVDLPLSTTGVVIGESEGHHGPAALSFSMILIKQVVMALECAKGALVPEAKALEIALKIAKAISGSGETAEVMVRCKYVFADFFGVGESHAAGFPGPGGSNISNHPGRKVGAKDPNEKVGPLGAGRPHYLTPSSPLSYAVFFENQPIASAPAGVVVVTDELDPASVDPSTVVFGPIAFGDKLIVPLSGELEVDEEVDLRPDTNLLVHVQARRVGSSLTWRFQSLDPATHRPPDDPLIGFLPPNMRPPAGEGRVVFTVLPRLGLATGTVVRNAARIVFDSNAPIDTPVWENIIDVTKPSSQVHPLDKIQRKPNFRVRWSGVDEGAGISDYSIFVSKDGEPFTVWLGNVTTTSAIFGGEFDRSYTFYSVARDLAGNVEDVPRTPDASTRVAEAKEAKMPPEFELSKATDGSFHFILRAGNNEPVLSSETYSSKPAAKNGIESVRRNAPLDDRYERKTSKGGQPYFVVKAANGEPIGTSEMYSSTASMENGINVVKQSASDAVIDDKT